ncbi:penicillin acylase family protein [Pseudalkalibacillus caeni]|uniref:Penicillin acylase family protein n=2 Tax=Exobacillus caeni TaxID=2574798 RepID=A0A5R9FBD4_9BACL|nr:penicillin acylase family protein [Pseudalkalibacillus caeni]TLS38988.1 penicillin acylase family protein [Pseudalkalibacillus caeni]
MNTPIPVRPEPRRHSRIKPVILGLLLIVIIAGAVGYGVLYKSLPVTRGELPLTQLSQNVSVYRDKSGVPHIEAKNMRDLFIAQGFVTAQDRLFQMDLSRRQASGELSEVIGAKTIERDKFFRTLGLRRAAEASLDGYSEEAREILDWYAEGVNAYIKQSKDNGSLPIEFMLLGYEPKKWTSIDSLTIGKYMAFDLGGHWEGQAFRYYLLQNFTEEEALDLFPSYPEDGSKVLQALRETPLDLSDRFASAVVPNAFNGSNNWVVSGKKTESGKPYLADDPHLGLATPAIWYETHLNSPDFKVNGVIFAGIPGIILGKNEHIAWGVTNVGPDVQDLYIEKRNPNDKNEFEYNGNWEKAEVINEKITVKDQKPIDYKVTITRHGPVISEFAKDDSPETALSMKWTALQPSTELEAVLRFGKAQNWDEFKEALTYFHTPAQNFVFASTDGTIAYRANGLIPIRKNGDSTVPVPGWTDEYEWEGFIPWKELPTIVNPEEGFISTANNKIAGDTYPYHITNTWAQPYRQNRIREVLSAKDKLSVKDMQSLQFDHLDLQAKEFIPILKSHLKGQKMRPVDKKALQLLNEWDFQDDPDSGAPLLFHIWMLEAANVLFEEKIDTDMMDLFEGKAQIVDQLIRQADRGNPGPWIQKAGGLPKIMLTSFQRAVDKSIELQGKTPAKWEWGTYHAVPFNHPLSAVKPLNLLFNPGSTPMGGSRVTVGAAGWSSATGEVNHGASWRSVVDLADIAKSFNVVGPGQSGHVLSRWYDDQIDEWTTGKYHLTDVTPEAYRKESEKLTLKAK